MGDWIEVLRRRRINDTRPFAWIDVDITQRSILDAMTDEPSLKDAEAIRWIRKGKCIGTTSPQCPGSEIYDGDDVDALLERITELESELATLRKDAAIGRAVRHSGVTLAWLIERLATKAQMMNATNTDVAEMQPVTIESGQHFVLAMSPWQSHQLRTETGDLSWSKIAQAAAAAEGRKSPIFKGGLGMVNNVILHEHKL